MQYVLIFRNRIASPDQLSTIVEETPPRVPREDYTNTVLRKNVSNRKYIFNVNLIAHVLW